MFVFDTQFFKSNHMSNTILFSPLKDFKIEISDECLESDPCQHDVVINGGEPQTMDAEDIEKLLQENNIRVPSHFSGDIVSDDDTEEETEKTR